jgi:membrane protein required for colicin V production
MNYFDLIITLPLAWGAIIGFKKGLILELASLVALFLGIWGSMRFSSLTATYLSEWLDASASLISLIAFVLTFVLIVLAVHLLAKLIDKSLKMVALGPLLRISGALFGILKYALILSVLMYAFEAINDRWQMVEAEKYQGSSSYQLLNSINRPIYNWLDQLEWDFAVEEEIDQI